MTRPTTNFLGLLLGLASMTFSVAQAADVPAGGKSVLSADVTTALELAGAQKQLGSAQAIDVTGVPFSKAIRITTTTAPRNEWDVQVVALTAGDVKDGDVCLARFWMRCADSMTGEGFTTFVFEESGGEYRKAKEFRIGANKDWTEVNVPFVARRDFAAGKAHVAFRAGFERQTIEIGGVEVLNFGPTAVKVDALPRTSITYAGREPDAPWRAEAQARIEKYRKGELTIRVTDASGKPVEGATVRARLVRHAFKFGTCVTAELLTSDSPDAIKYRDFVEKHCNYAVFENDMKWPAMIDGVSPKTDQALAWLLERGIEVRGHNLHWPSWQWTPKPIAAYKDNPAELRRVCANRVTSAVSHFRGKLACWDVVNEVYSNHDLIDVLGGRDVLIDWFKLAHEADPNCRLVLNDFGILEGGRSSVHRQEFYDTIKWLKDSGAPIGGIGMQSHFGTALPDPQQLVRVLDQFDALGLPIESTELSINLDDRDRALQADYVRDYVTTLFSHPRVRGIMLWGFWEKRHWRPQAALFAADWSIRPHGQAWLDLIEKSWTTDASAQTDSSGSTTVRGFCGEYEITVTVDGKSQTVRATLGREGATSNVTAG